MPSCTPIIRFGLVKINVKGDKNIMSIRERKGKKGVSYQVYFPYKNELGITCTYRKGGFKTKREAKTHETLVKAQIEKDGFLKQECKLTLNQVFNDYFETFKNRKVSKATIKLYGNIYKNHIKQELGHYKIVKIKYPTLQKYFNECSSMSQGLQFNIKKILSNVFKYACKCCYIENNPVSLVDLTGYEIESKKETITFQELEMIIEAVKNRKCNDSFRNDSIVISLYTGYYLGLRISEALALEKSDFDFINNTVNIDKQLNNATKIEDIKPTDKLKTKTSKAILPLPEPLKEILMDWFKVNPYDHVICDVEGNYLCTSCIATMLNKESKKMGIYFHFHMLRHTFISNLANNGISPQIAKELARHSDIATTMNIYTHVNEDSQKQAINAVFNSKSVKKVSNASLLAN